RSARRHGPAALRRRPDAIESVEDAPVAFPYCTLNRTLSFRGLPASPGDRAPMTRSPSPSPLPSRRGHARAGALRRA
ncbi:hypothetical protein, partial [Burkholderia sp. Ac-20379]|uniref:hypothetical protein n=1 Tax=Burkholderia sp. Ac-20379 TaxID=2703900 RepID=UPI00197EAFAD